MKTEKMYMFTKTGSVDTYDGWYYEDEDGTQRNAVDDGDVIEVVWDEKEDDWIAAEEYLIKSHTEES